MAFVVHHTDRRVYVNDCDLWLGADGRVHFVTRDGHHDFISLENHRLVQTGRCPVGEYETGRKRAKAMLKAMQWGGQVISEINTSSRTARSRSRLACSR